MKVEHIPFGTGLVLRRNTKVAKGTGSERITPKDTGLGKSAGSIERNRQ